METQQQRRRRWWAPRPIAERTIADVWRAVRFIAWGMAAVVLSFVLTMIVVVAAQGHTNSQFTQKQIDDSYTGCLRFNDTRSLFRDVVEIAYSSNGTLDLTKVPGFAALPGPDQDFFRSLAVQSAAASAATRTDPKSNLNKIRGRLQLRDCEAEYPDRSPGLTATTEAAQ